MPRNPKCFECSKYPIKTLYLRPNSLFESIPLATCTNCNILYIDIAAPGSKKNFLRIQHISPLVGMIDGNESPFQLYHELFQRLNYLISVNIDISDIITQCDDLGRDITMKYSDDFYQMAMNTEYGENLKQFDSYYDLVPHPDYESQVARELDSYHYYPIHKNLSLQPYFEELLFSYFKLKSVPEMEWDSIHIDLLRMLQKHSQLYSIAMENKEALVINLLSLQKILLLNADNIPMWKVPRVFRVFMILSRLIVTEHAKLEKIRMQKHKKSNLFTNTFDPDSYGFRWAEILVLPYSSSNHGQAEMIFELLKDMNDIYQDPSKTYSVFNYFLFDGLFTDFNSIEFKEKYLKDEEDYLQDIIKDYSIVPVYTYFFEGVKLLFLYISEKNSNFSLETQLTKFIQDMYIEFRSRFWLSDNSIPLVRFVFDLMAVSFGKDLQILAKLGFSTLEQFKSNYNFDKYNDEYMTRLQPTLDRMLKS
ncbi:MAG: hypothetical protein GPJ54_01135 [Candidatus Heimdallarchaeota archaeon]|nr:hypothetical protein [Candidatus Heimdallarchaeota archaeon]